MQNNNLPIDQLSTLSKEQLLHLVRQERTASQALLDEYQKMNRMALKYWIMSELLSLHLFCDPVMLLDRLGSLASLYSGWAEGMDVEPC